MIKCVDCEFYVPRIVKDEGNCRRYPPQLIASMNNNFFALFPDVQEFHWCGEWKPRDDSKKEKA